MCCIRNEGYDICAVYALEKSDGCAVYTLKCGTGVLCRH